MSPGRKSVLHNIFIWGATALCIWWVARDVTFGKFFDSLKQANLWMFVLANVASFLMWWLGDNLLFSLQFTFFHKKTGYRELLPATAAQYFLQAINILAADGALVAFLNRRKGVRWLTATWTIMFQGLIDALALSGLMTAAGLLFPQSKIRVALPYAGGAFGFLVAVALWWALAKPKRGLARWMHERPSAHAFRAAGIREYLTLGSIRLSLMVAQGFLYYFSIAAFAPAVPLLAVLALTPGILASSNEPITPQGLGPMQAIMASGLSAFAPHDTILAAALGISVLQLLCRLPLGLGVAGTFAHKVLAIEAARQDAGREEDSAAEKKQAEAETS